MIRILIGFFIIVFLSSCSSISGLFKSDKKLIRVPIVNIPVKDKAEAIQEHAQDTIEIAEDLGKEYPEVLVKTDNIVLIQKQIKSHATEIEALQVEIDNQSENLKKERKAAIQAEKERDQAIKDKDEAIKKAEEKNVSTIVTVLKWVIGGSMIVIGIGILLMIKVKFSLGLNLVIAAGIIAGLSIFTIYFLKWIAYTFGLMIIIGLGYLAYVLWDHAQEKRKKEELKKTDEPNSPALQKELLKDEYKKKLKEIK